MAMVEGSGASTASGLSLQTKRGSVAIRFLEPSTSETRSRAAPPARFSGFFLLRDATTTLLSSSHRGERERPALMTRFPLPSRRHPSKPRAEPTMISGNAEPPATGAAIANESGACVLAPSTRSDGTARLAEEAKTHVIRTIASRTAVFQQHYDISAVCLDRKELGSGPAEQLRENYPRSGPGQLAIDVPIDYCYVVIT